MTLWLALALVPDAGETDGPLSALVVHTLAWVASLTG